MDVPLVDVAGLELDDSNLDRSAATRLVTAGIWLRTSRRDFPARGWDDFAVVILGAWADAVLRLISGELSTARVDFMDGPYYVEITPVAPDEWRLVLVERRQSRQLEDVVRADAGKLVESLISASARLLTSCRQRGWESRDSERLDAGLRTLRDFAKTRGWMTQ
jgi:hypothetical protein